MNTLTSDLKNHHAKSVGQASPTLVLAGGRPSSNFLLEWIGLRLPPVFLRLCQESREIPMLLLSPGNGNSYISKLWSVIAETPQNYSIFPVGQHLSCGIGKSTC